MIVKKQPKEVLDIHGHDILFETTGYCREGHTDQSLSRLKWFPPTKPSTNQSFYRANKSIEHHHKAEGTISTENNWFGCPRSYFLLYQVHFNRKIYNNGPKVNSSSHSHNLVEVREDHCDCSKTCNISSADTDPQNIHPYCFLWRNFETEWIM